MEPHKNLGSGTEKYRPVISNGPQEYFEKAFCFTSLFYGEELLRIWSVKTKDVNPELATSALVS